jgi:hypothetical protein
MTIVCADADGSDFWSQGEEVSSSLCRVDFLVFAVIIGFGALQCCYSQPWADFRWEDVFYADSARAIAQQGFYGINGCSETNMPPGLSVILALIGYVYGYSHAVFLRAMTIFGTLGFLASYELLRRESPRIVAATICLLLISSQIYFENVTRNIASCYPYFFASTSALLVARQFDQSISLVWRVAWGVLLTALIVASLMFDSVGIAFLGAILASIGVVFLRDRRLAATRARTYLLVFLIGAGLQGCWMTRTQPEASAGIRAADWPLRGFPHSYLSQLKVKSGNDPEEGLATPRDIAQRVLENSYDYSDLLHRFLCDRWNHAGWTSFATIGVLFLVFTGWCYSVWLTGGDFQDWYFAGYGFIFLFWPWYSEMRFLLPVAPLACLYMWRGVLSFVFLTKNKSRVLGIAWLIASILLMTSSLLWMHGVRITTRVPHAWTIRWFFLIGLLSTVWAAWLIGVRNRWLTASASTVTSWIAKLSNRSQLSQRHAAQLLSLTALVCLTAQGLTWQIHIGRVNQNPHLPVNRPPAEDEAGAWIHSHTDTNTVVMARHVPTVYHYAHRKVIWFPPSTNSELLMDGILKHKVNFVIVVRREYNYYLPPDDECFAVLLNAYPSMFRLVFQTPEFRIFEVIPNSVLHVLTHKPTAFNRDTRANPQIQRKPTYDSLHLQC